MSGITLMKTDAASIPTPAADKATIFLDEATGEPSYKDDAAVVASLVGAAGTDGTDGADGTDGVDGALTAHDYGNSGASPAIDADAYSIQRRTMNAATVTYTLTTAETIAVVRHEWVQDGTGSRVLSHPGSVDFGTLGAPTLPTTPGSVYPIDYYTIDGGTSWRAIAPMRPGPTGAAGSNGTNGVDGTVGGAISIDYTFSTTTTDSDPGSGNLRLSNATQTSAVTIRADLLDAHGVDWTAVLDTLADASNTVKGHIRLFKKSDPTKWLLCTVSAVATPSGYRNITIANVGSSGANPLGNGDAITLAFSRSGDQGSTVGAGTLTTVEEVDGSPTDSAVTKLVVPNGSLAISTHVATLTFPSAGTQLNPGTSFPGSPSSGDYCLRTDRNILYQYDGTRWLCTCPHQRAWPYPGTAALSATTVPAYEFLPDDYDIYVTKLWAVFYASSLGSGAYWTVSINSQTATEVETTIGSVNDQSGTNSQWQRVVSSPNALVASASTAKILRWIVAKTGSPAAVQVSAGYAYRLVG